jgi:hypothetical protein
MKIGLPEIMKIPLLVTALGLVVAWIVLFVWSVNQKVDAHIRSGRAALEYLTEFDSVVMDSCREVSTSGETWVFVSRADGSELRLQDFVQDQKADKESTFARLLKENSLSLDFIPVNSCRLWPKILALSSAKLEKPAPLDLPKP